MRLYQAQHYEQPEKVTIKVADLEARVSTYPSPLGTILFTLFTLYTGQGARNPGRLLISSVQTIQGQQIPGAERGNYQTLQFGRKIERLHAIVLAFLYPISTVFFVLDTLCILSK